MEGDPSASRDPRLSSRANWTTTARTSIGSLEAQSPSTSQPPYRPTVEAQNGTSESFIRGISDLVQAAVVAATSRSDKERLQKKLENTDELLKKAKSHSSFPSTAEFFQQIRNDEDVDMKRIDECIRQYESNYRRLENELKSRWTTSVGSQPSKSEHKIDQLERDLVRTKQKSSDSYSNTERLVAQNKTFGQELKQLQEKFDKEMKTVQDALTNQRKSFASYTESLSVQARDLQQNTKDIQENHKAIQANAQISQGNIEQMKKLELALKDASSDKSEALSSQHQRTIDDLKKEVNGWADKINAICKEHEANLMLPEQLNKKLEDQQRKIDQLGRSPGIDRNLELAAQPQLNRKFDELQQILSTKDELQFAEMEEVQKSIKDLKEVIERVPSNLNSLTAQSTAIDTRVTNLTSGVHHLQQHFDTVRVGLHSLETRYNNLTTEPIVQSMVGAMHEMYPSLDQMLSGLSAQKRQMDSEFPPLKARLEQLENQIKHTALSQNEINRLKIDQSNLSQSLSSLRDKYTTQSQLPTQEEFRRIQSDFDALSGKLNDVESELKSRKTEHDTLREDMREEQGSLNSKITSFNNMVQQLKAEFNEIKSDNNSESVMLELLPRIEFLEKSIADGHQDLRDQLDKLQEAINSAAASSNNGIPLIQRIQAPAREGSSGIKKRPHPPSDDENSSLRGLNSPTLPPDPNTARKKHKKQKKKSKSRPGREEAATEEAPIVLLDD